MLFVLYFLCFVCFDTCQLDVICKQTFLLPKCGSLSDALRQPICLKALKFHGKPHLLSINCEISPICIGPGCHYVFLTNSELTVSLPYILL